MGFKWSVGIAHYFAQSCVKQSFDLFKASRLSTVTNPNPVFILKESTPIRVTRSSPVVLHIIDDISVVMHKWNEKAALLLYKIIRSILSQNGLPIKEAKSSPFNKGKDLSITFIGCTWKFGTGDIYPSNEHVLKVREDISLIAQSKSVQSFCFDRTVGRLVWLSLLNRPALSNFLNVFNIQKEESHAETTIINEKIRREFLMAYALLPLCRLNTKMPLSNLVICFDASLSHGGVVAATGNQDEVTALFNAYSQNILSGSVLRNLTAFIRSRTWTHVKQKRWKKKEPIYALEAATAVLSLIWAVSEGISNTKIIIITDSEAVKFAMAKGRFSVLPMLLRCRCVALLCIAYNIRVKWIYINSADNPADVYTRSSFPHANKEL